MFGFKTKEKLKMFKKRVHEILCIDATRKTNQYKFPLRNLVVLGEFYKGYLIAHLICNTEDEPVLIPFFPAIKERCCNPNIQINASMTDNHNSGWNAFLRIFRDCTQLLWKLASKMSFGKQNTTLW